MRLIFTLFLIFNVINAKNIDFSSFEGSFIQSIYSPEGAKIDYEGKLYIKQNNKLLWIYEKPIKKYIYLLNDKIHIIEPDLEQAIISKNNDLPNFTNILKNAKQVKDDLFVSNIDGLMYFVRLKDKTPTQIHYKDKLENKVSIIFSNVKLNAKIKDDIFMPKIPSSYDIIEN